MRKLNNKILNCNVCTAVRNLALAYVMWMFTRLVFFVVNWSVFAPGLTWTSCMTMLRGSLVFDTTAILYVNSLFLVLMLFPLHIKEREGFHKGLRWLFVATNAVALLSNIVDSVYFQFTGRRSTVSVFSEFAREDNIASIFMSEFVSHWYLVLVFAFVVWALWRCYTAASLTWWHSRKVYYWVQVPALLLAVPLAIVGIRGSVFAGTMPITINNANQYASRAAEVSLVLNTPFTMIRSIGKQAFVTPDYMPVDEMERTFTPVVEPLPGDSAVLRGKNVVVLIMESLGKEYTSYYNGGVGGHTPFIDSIASQSLTFKYSFANGRKSMDAMPSILCGIPMFVEPFFLTPASTNEITGLSRQLGEMGYHSAFFHGGHNISMGFSAFAHAIGFNTYTGLDEYCESPKYHGMDDFDGKWAIWDEEFLQFFADSLQVMRQPFVTTFFSATTHHPFAIPERYKGIINESGHPMNTCWRYTDMALRRFFERVSHEPWYSNTVFVIVADHTNHAERAEYLTDLGVFEVPIIFYTPDGSLKPQLRDDVVAQQIDISPTLLHLLGYDKRFMSFGKDLLHAPDHSWAVNYNNGIYQLVQDNLLLQFDGEKTVGLYDYRSDRLLKHNLAVTNPAQPAMEKKLKAIIQQYMKRMNENRLVEVQ